MKLPKILIEDLVRSALQEDLGRAGDITTQMIVPESAKAKAVMNARAAGIIAGLDAACMAFSLLEPGIAIERLVKDGEAVKAGQDLAVIEGPAHAVLAAERTALNFLSHLSGIATETGRYVEAVEGGKAKIVCTRKTTPGLRTLEKYAVRMGGGMNHRFGLDDAVLIKDNHIALAGGIREAVQRARSRAGHMVKIEVETDKLDQLDEILDLGADAVLLDNMSPETLKEAVRRIDGRMLTEASGGVSLDNVRQIAATGVDMISVGAVTHSAKILDIGLDADV